MKNSRLHWATLLVALIAAPAVSQTTDRGFYLGLAYSSVSATTHRLK